MQQVQGDQATSRAMKMEMVEDATGKLVPPWMKSKLQGVKKVPNRVRRRRQNEVLRRLLTPKNALSVLNEILPGEHVSSVEPSDKPLIFGNCNSSTTFCANLELCGLTYRGYGENKMGARNAAAEQAIRDIMLQKMRALGSDDDSEQAAIPMMQLASYALHKLFAEWEESGHKVPQLRPRQMEEESESLPAPAPCPAPPAPPAPPGLAAVAKKPRELPPNPSEMHPCMLLTYMRPQLECREVSVEGEKPQNMLFTMAVDVDGRSYFGKACNKKEARKQAARAACEAVFGVRYTST